MKYFMMFLTLALFSCASSQNKNSMSFKISQQIPKEIQQRFGSLSHDEIAKVANEGFEKLSLENLYRLNQLRLKIVRSSLNNCKSLMQPGSFTKDELFKSLDEKEADDYSSINAKAFTLGDNPATKGSPRPTKTAFEKALTIVYSAPDSMFMKYKQKNKIEEDCWALEKILSYTDEKRNSAAETMVRYMSSF